MKKTLYFFIGIIIVISSCKYPGDGSTPPPACDNTTVIATIGLDWNGTSYLCTYGSFGNQMPPNASPYNYLTQVSATGFIGSLSNPYAYLCQITSRNTQNATTPTAPCGPAVAYTYSWNKAGASLANVAVFKNEPTYIHVDYYDICAQCNSSGGSVRPWFIGTIGIPKQAAPSVWTVALADNGNYSGTNCQ